MMSPADRLKKFRQHVQASQRDLAQVFGVAPGAIAMWENGTREISGPGLVLLERLEREFGIQNGRNCDPSLDTSHLSRLFADRILLSTGSKPALEKSGEAESFRGAVHEMAEHYLSPVSGVRKIQVSLVEKILDSVADAKGLSLKVIQLASFIDFGISIETQDLLLRLQRALSPMPARAIKQIFNEDFGQDPEILFAEWNPNPIAAASIGQVHRARLKSGELVAVKVQYPNIHKKVVRQTHLIQLLSALVGLVRNDYSEMLSSFVKKIREECDYENEARNLEAFGKAFSVDSQIRIPRLYREFSSARVLTMEFIEGREFHEFARNASQEERNLVGSIIHRFNYESTMRHGLLQTDSQPGNYLVTTDNQVACLDFGRVVRQSQEALEGTRKFYQAVHRNDPETAKLIMKELGYVRDWKGFRFDEFWAIMRTQMDYELSDKRVQFSKKYVQQIWRLANSFKQRGHLTMTSHFFWPVFASASLWSLLAELEAENRWRDNVERTYAQVD